jgi:hypothetical protein
MKGGTVNYRTMQDRTVKVPDGNSQTTKGLVVKDSTKVEDGENGKRDVGYGLERVVQRVTKEVVMMQWT